MSRRTERIALRRTMGLMLLIGSGLSSREAHATVIDVPYDSQNNMTTSCGSCGSASTGMGLAYLGGKNAANDVEGWLYAGLPCAPGEAPIVSRANSYCASHGLPSPCATTYRWSGDPWGHLVAEINAGRPFVAHVHQYGYGHYLLVTGYGDGQVYLNDPVPSRRGWRSWSEFSSQWRAKSYGGIRFLLGAKPACNPTRGPLGSGSRVTGGCSGAAPNPPAPAKCGVLKAGEGLVRGGRLTSCDDRFALLMQDDGNLVLYSNGTALWSTGTYGTEGAGVIMQGDGNLVLYSTSGCPLWASNTYGTTDGWMALQNDGNLVVYGSGAARFATGTGPIPDGPTECGLLAPGRALAPGTTLWSCKKCFNLTMQGDGNLVLYGPEGPLWSSGTYNTDGYVAEMQGDGNLVLTSKAGCPLWHSNTWNHPGARLVVQDDGNLVIYGAAGPLWASNTMVRPEGADCRTSSEGDTVGDKSTSSVTGSQPDDRGAADPSSIYGTGCAVAGSEAGGLAPLGLLLVLAALRRRRRAE